MVVDHRPLQAVPVRPRPALGLLRRPSLLVGLTVLLVGVPEGDGLSSLEVATVTPADIGAAVLVAVVAVRLLAAGQLPALRDPLFLCPALVVVTALISTIWSTDPLVSLVGVVRYTELFCVVPLAVVLSIKDRVDVVIVLGAVVALGVVEGGIGVFQSVTGTGAGYAGETRRAIGTFGVESVLSMATVVALAQIVLIAVALNARGQTRVWSAVAAAALLVPLLLSLSRGALLATACAAGVVLVATGVLRAVRVAVLSVAAVVLGFALVAGVDSSADDWVNSVAERVGSLGDVVRDPDSSVQDRYDLWATAVSIWHVNPMTGVGIKQFPAYRDSHAPLGMSSGSELVTTDSYSRGELLSPHNQYLLVLSEQGVLGLGAFLALLLALLARHVSLLRSRGVEGGARFLPLVSLGLFVWFAVHLAYGDFGGSTSVLFAVLLGVQLRSAISDRAPLSDQ